jgi:hypothetical protein
MASNGTINLAGKIKANNLIDRFGNGGFDADYQTLCRIQHN